MCWLTAALHGGCGSAVLFIMQMDAAPLDWHTKTRICRPHVSECGRHWSLWFMCPLAVALELHVMLWACVSSLSMCRSDWRWCSLTGGSVCFQCPFTWRNEHEKVKNCVDQPRGVRQNGTNSWGTQLDSICVCVILKKHNVWLIFGWCHQDTSSAILHLSQNTSHEEKTCWVLNDS